MASKCSFMNHIIQFLDDNNWKAIKEIIKSDNFDPTYFVDQINGPLHYLVYHNKINLIEMIDPVKLKNIINIQNAEGDTICHIAAKLKNVEFVNYCLKIDSEIIYIKNNLNCTPLFYLVSDSIVICEIVKMIDIYDHYLNDMYTLTQFFVLTKNFKMLQFVLDNIKINNLTNNILFDLIESDISIKLKLKIFNMLKKYSLDINYLNEKLMSPLIFSLRHGFSDVTEFLLDNDANINYYGPENNDHPLSIAIETEDISSIYLLLNHNIDFNVRDKNLKTSVHHVFLKKNNIPLNIKQKLLYKAKNINQTDNQMNSILSLLIQNDNWKKYANILQDKKLKIHNKNKNGLAPIDFIDKYELPEFIELVYQSHLNKLDNKILLTMDNNSIDQYKEYIMKKIITVDYSRDDNKTQLKLIICPETNITHFSAYTYNYICFLYYILEKYPHVKIPAMAPDQMKDKKPADLYQELVKDWSSKKIKSAKIFRSIIKDYVFHSPILINHVIIWENNHTFFFSPYIIQGIYETIRKYPTTRFIILKMTIITEKNFNHANILVLDINNKSVERFDPYGNVSFYYGRQIDKLLKIFFSEFFQEKNSQDVLYGIKYMPPSKLFDGVSFQIFSDEKNKMNYVENDPAGFCVAWCLWYVEMRAKNLEIDPASLIEESVMQINEKQYNFKDYIRDYANLLDSKKNIILEKAGVMSKYWYRLHIPIVVYKAYLKYIRNIYDLIT